jgi:hypothetical protein
MILPVACIPLVKAGISRCCAWCCSWLRRHAQGLLLGVLLACSALTAVGGQTCDWSLGATIDCPLALSTPAHVATRTIVFPSGAITDVPAFWDAESQLYVKIIRNCVVLQLRDPRFSATLQVFDDKGDLFLVTVHAAADPSLVDDALLVRPAGGGAGAEAQGRSAEDSDGQVTELMAAMVGPRNASVACTLVTRVENGTVVPGRHLYADHTLSLDLMHLYQGAHLHGYQCVLTYHGTRTVRLDQSRLWFPGALAVYASAQVFIDPRTVGIEIQPQQTILLYFVAE